MEQIRQASVLGRMPEHSFYETATHYLKTKKKDSLAQDAMNLKILAPYLKDLNISEIRDHHLDIYREDRRLEGVKNRTINSPLETLRHLLNLAEKKWVDKNDLHWLAKAPTIEMLPLDDARPPYPLSFQEEKELINQCEGPLKLIVPFASNTGTRKSEVLGLRWEWEIRVPELNISVFVIPKNMVKNREPRLVVLNDKANEIIESVRGEHPEFVFTHEGMPIESLRSIGWNEARENAKLPHIRFHDLKHTYGRRLFKAGVSIEIRRYLLGHKVKKDSVTNHYSEPDLETLLEHSNKVCHMKINDSPTYASLLQRAS
ncbi:MAG: site-specific integrase [Candidatus Thiodiazotropha sp.]